MTQGFNKVTLTNPNQILLATNPYMAVGVVVSDSGLSADSNGKKILKAGTPVTGSLEDRNTAFTKTATSNAVGVLLHDVDVTSGSNNAELLIFGFVNLKNLDSDVQSLIDSTIKTALKGSVTFLK